jgi:elongation factor G
MLPLRQVISAQRPADAMALAEALAACAAADPSLMFASGPSPDTFNIEAATPNELARRLALVRAKATIPIDAGPVTVLPCWTPGRLAEAEHRLGTADGGSGNFAVVRLRVVPRRSGEGNIFESEFAGPPEIDALKAAVARGVARAWAEGAEGEGRMIDTRVVFIDGAFHSSRSTPEGFEQAAVAAMRSACRTSGLRRLEPLMEIEIMSERDHVLTVVNDLATRGGSELRRRLGPKGVVVVAELPMRALLTYEGDLATLTKGRGKLIGEPRLSRWAEVRRR